MTTVAKLKNGWGGAFLLLALSLSVLLPSAPALGQAPSAPNPERPGRRRYKTPSVDEQVEGLSKNLDLNEAQQSAVKEILLRRQQHLLRILRDPSPTGSDRMIKLRALQASTVAQIRSVLNDEQKKKYNPVSLRPQQTSPQPSVEDWMKATPPQRTKP